MENLGFIIDQLGHAVDLIRNRLSNIDSTHRQMTLSDTSCHGNPKVILKKLVIFDLFYEY